MYIGIEPTRTNRIQRRFASLTLLRDCCLTSTIARCVLSKGKDPPSDVRTCLGVFLLQARAGRKYAGQNHLDARSKICCTCVQRPPRAVATLRELSWPAIAL